MMFKDRLTRFERTRIIAARYMMLMRGAPPLVDVEGKKSLKEVAEEELRTRRLPLTIVRLSHGEEGFEKILVPLSEIKIIDESEIGEIRCSRV